MDLTIVYHRIEGFSNLSGYNIGVRLIDDFLARNPTISRCNDFRETADVLAKVTWGDRPPQESSPKLVRFSL